MEKRAKRTITTDNRQNVLKLTTKFRLTICFIDYVKINNIFNMWILPFHEFYE